MCQFYDTNKGKLIIKINLANYSICFFCERLLSSKGEVNRPVFDQNGKVAAVKRRTTIKGGVLEEIGDDREGDLGGVPDLEVDLLEALEQLEFGLDCPPVLLRVE